MPNFDKGDGFIAAIAQDWQTGEVLMLAWMNEAAYQLTVETGNATYWSRSRGKLWKKGESSGHVQKVKEILVDCDQDAVLLKVEQLGGVACHTGRRSCFSWKPVGDKLQPIAEPLVDPQTIYGA